MYWIIHPGVWPVTGWANLRHQLDALWCETRANIWPKQFFLFLLHWEIYLSARAIGHFVCDPRQMTNFVHIHWPCDLWWANNLKWYSSYLLEFWHFKFCYGFVFFCIQIYIKYALLVKSACSIFCQFWQYYPAIPVTSPFPMRKQEPKGFPR